MLNVNSEIQIPDEELSFTFSRSSGPGGQNVNKVASKATLRWSPGTSAGLPEAVRHRFLKRYANRLSRDGELILNSQRYRDQGRNIADCLEKLRAMLAAVARPPRRRRPTKPTAASRERRLTQKRGQSAKKQRRRLPREEA